MFNETNFEKQQYKRVPLYENLISVLKRLTLKFVKSQ
jgi:hypothetical protein